MRGRKNPLKDSKRNSRADLPEIEKPIVALNNTNIYQALLCFQHIQEALSKKRSMNLILGDFASTNNHPLQEWGKINVDRINRGEDLIFDQKFFPPIINAIYQSSKQAGQDLKSVLPRLIELCERSIKQK